MRRRSWTVIQLSDAAKESTSIRQVLMRLGLKEAGGNYAQIQKYLRYHQINITHFTGKGWNKGKKGIGKAKISLNEILVRESTFQSGFVA